jgi:hypothetical protein
MSAPSLNDFISKTKLGLARTNRYTISIATPGTIQKNVSATGVNLQTVHMFCDQVQLPGLNVNSTQIKTFGEIREMPYEFNYDPIQMNFYVDRNMVVKSYFDEWINSIQKGEARTFNYYNDYISPSLIIEVQDSGLGTSSKSLIEKNDTRYMVILYEAYPRTISAVQMGYDQKDVMKLSVTMNYKYWRSVNTPDDSPSDVSPPSKYKYSQDQRDVAYGNYKQSNYSPMDQMLLQLERDNIAFTAEVANSYTGNTGTPSQLINDYFSSSTNIRQ